MAAISYWEHQSFFNGIDVAIIGSGIVGLNAAIHLKRNSPALRIAVFERGSLPTGASTRNAGFACFGSVSELVDDMKTQSKDEVFELVEKRWRGLLELRKLLGDPALEYQTHGGYEIFDQNDTPTFESCQSSLADFNHHLHLITGHKETYLVRDDKIRSFAFGNVAHLILNQCEGQLNTGAMMKALLKLARNMEIEVFNGMSIKHIEENGTNATLLMEENASITAWKVLLATNGFTKRLFPQLDVIPARNQVLVTQPIANLTLKGCFHYDRGYFYFRNVEGPEGSRILLGGGRHLALEEEKTDEFGQTPLIMEALKKLLRETILPSKSVRIEYWWSGIMGLGPSKKPIIEMVSPSVGVAVRMGGMGVALGNLVGKEAALMISSQL